MMEMMPAIAAYHCRNASLMASVFSVNPEMMKMVTMLMVWKTAHDPTFTDATARPGQGQAREKTMAVTKPMTRKFFKKKALKHGQVTVPLGKHFRFDTVVADGGVVRLLLLLSSSLGISFAIICSVQQCRRSSVWHPCRWATTKFIRMNLLSLRLCFFVFFCWQMTI